MENGHDNHMTKLRSSKDIKLNTEELKVIHLEISEVEKDLEESLTNKRLNVNGVYLSVSISVVFIFLCFFINHIESIYAMKKIITDHYEVKAFKTSPASYFKDIKQQADLEQYIRHVVLPSTFDSVSINMYNYMVGVRISLKLANMIENPYREYSEVLPTVRENPYMEYDQNTYGASDSNIPY